MIKTKKMEEKKTAREQTKESVQTGEVSSVIGEIIRARASEHKQKICRSLLRCNSAAAAPRGLCSPPR